MILTGKCADRFKEWLENSNHTPWVVFFESLPPLVQYVYYVEWFDEQGIYCDAQPVGYEDGKMTYIANVIDKEELYDIEMTPTSRTEALKAAIEKGNQILNER